MNIFNKVALQGLKKNRTRTFVTIIGVVLSAALISAVATFAVSLQNYMVNGAIAKYGDWHIAFYDADSSFAQEQATNDEVSASAITRNIGYAELKGSINPDKPYLFMSGYSEEAFEMLPITLYSGRMPENSGEVLVSAKVAADGGVKFEAGDTITLVVGERMYEGKTLNQSDPYNESEEFVPQGEKTYTVVGICQRPIFEENDAAGYSLITRVEAVENIDSCTLFVTMKNPNKLHTYIDKAGENREYLLNDYVLRFMGLSDNNLFNSLIYVIGGIVIAIIMVGSVFLIYNSFNISLSERTHQFGILMSIGATEKQLRNSVLFEGLCIGAIGIPIGIIVSIPSIKLVLSLVAKNFGNVLYDNVPLTLKVSVPVLIAAAVIGMISILISAYIPARKAARTPVMECIRQTNEVKLEAKAIRTSKLAERIYGLEGMIALKNFKRNKRRYRSIILSLTLSVVLFISVSTFGNYLNQIAEQSTVDIDGDIIFYTKNMEEDEFFQLYSNLKTTSGVYDSTYQAISTYSCEVETSKLTKELRIAYCEYAGIDAASETAEFKMDVQFIEDDILQEFVEDLGLPTAEYSGKNAKMIIVGKKGSNVDMFANRSMDFTINGEAEGQTKTIHTTFVDSYPLDPLTTEKSEVKGYTLMVVAPYQMKAQFDMLDAPTKLGAFFWSDNPGQTVTEMQTMIDGAAITADYNIYNIKAILEQNNNLIFIVNLFTAVFIAMISLIAVANVFNTISTNIKLRRRELAMLRSIGMSDRGFNKMMRFECALYGARTMLWGLPLSVIFCLLIYLGMVAGSIEGSGITFVLPWGSIGISVLGVFIIIFITMLYATSKIKKENIIDALRDDMA